MKYLFVITFSVLVLGINAQQQFANLFGKELINSLQEPLNCEKSDNLTAQFLLGDYSTAMSTYFGSATSQNKNMPTLNSVLAKKDLAKISLKTNLSGDLITINSSFSLNAETNGIFRLQAYLADRKSDNEYSNLRSLIGKTDQPFSVIPYTVSAEKAINYEFTINVKELNDATELIVIAYDFSKSGETSVLTAKKINLSNKNKIGINKDNNASYLNNISIFPNPNNGTFTLKTDGLDAAATSNMMIVNSIGQVVVQKKISNNSNLSIEGLSKGFYNVVVDGIASKKIIVE